jgi:hypothetical protein
MFLLYLTWANIILVDQLVMVFKIKLLVHPVGKYVVLYLMTLFVLLSNNKSFGQNTDKNFNRDSSKTISLVEFNYRVDRAAELLKTKELSAISDTDHINIMMCLNTIFMVRKKHSIEQVFTGSRYKELETLADKLKYGPSLSKVYTKVIPNRGMGFYFPQLKMELYGTPYRYAIFNVLE